MAEATDSIRTTTERLRQFRSERQWDRFHTPRNLAIALVVEIGELLEHLQWRDDDEARKHAKRCSEEVAQELADVAIHVFQLADVLGIDLPEALHAKLSLNATRYSIDDNPSRSRS